VDFRTALIEETKAFGELIRQADPATPVPTCPGWTLNQLFKHVGRGNRWAAQIVAERRYEPLDPRMVTGGKPPDDPDAAMVWLSGGVELLLHAVDQVGSDTRVWTFLGLRPAGWWIRRRLHEATVHRADAALAVGADFRLSPELAADAITEWIDRVTVQADPQSAALARGTTLHLHATDDGLGPTGEWTITHDEDGLNWSHGHAKGDAAVRGTVVDLMLATTGRRTAAEAGVEVFGDAAVWDGWLSRTQF
jgi:uncharacterized protein (TIGR03083 family)